MTKVKPRDLRAGMRMARINDDLGTDWVKVLDVQRQNSTSTRYRIDLEDKVTGGRSIYVHATQLIEIHNDPAMVEQTCKHCGLAVYPTQTAQGTRLAHVGSKMLFCGIKSTPTVAEVEQA